MKIMKYLFKPMKIIVVLCMISALIYYRSIIFHSNVNGYINVADSYIEQIYDVDIPEYINDVKTIDVAVNNVSNMDDLPVNVDGNNSEDTVNNTALNDSKKDDLIIDAVTEKESAVDSDSNQIYNASDVIASLSETVSAINNKVDALFEKNDADAYGDEDLSKGDKALASSVNKDAAVNNINDTPTASNDTESPNIKNMLLMARKSYWNGNIQSSEKFYLDLADLEDSNPDIYGELGNVYYAQGKWGQAGKAYYEAAVRLLALKQDNQVSYLLRVIQGLDTESADKLRHKISG